MTDRQERRRPHASAEQHGPPDAGRELGQDASSAAEREVGQEAVSAAERNVGPAADEPRLSLYPRLLGLRHVRLRPWHRGVLAEGSLAVAVLLTLADLATAWTLLVLPLAVAALVKLHDVVAGLIDADAA